MIVMIVMIIMIIIISYYFKHIAYFCFGFICNVLFGFEYLFICLFCTTSTTTTTTNTYNNNNYYNNNVLTAVCRSVLPVEKWFSHPAILVLSTQTRLIPSDRRPLSLFPEGHLGLLLQSDHLQCLLTAPGPD